jgi:thiol-disulfide isomerase/thioredoxin
MPNWTHTPWFKNALWVIGFVAFFLVVRGLMQGEPIQGKAPELTVENILGQKLDMAAYQGKPYMIQFWATWCPICELETAGIEGMIQDGYPVINIAINSGTNKEVLAYALQNGMSPKHIVNDPEGELFARFGAKAVPASFFVDSQGNVAFVEVGYTTSIGMKLRLWLAD